MERPPEVNIMQGPQNVPSYVGTKLFVYGSVSAEHNSLPAWIQEMTPLSSDWNRLQMQENWTKKKNLLLILKVTKHFNRFHIRKMTHRQ